LLTKSGDLSRKGEQIVSVRKHKQYLSRENDVIKREKREKGQGI